MRISSPRRCLLSLAGVAVAAALLPAGASASTTLDIRGTYVGTAEANGGTYQNRSVIDTENCTAGTFSGGGVGYSTFTGTINGNQDTSHEVYTGQSYTDDSSGTFSTDSQGRLVHTGAFHDSNGTSGTFSATRISGPPAPPAPGCTGPAPPPPPPPPGAKHATSMRVMCTYVVATSTDTCTATVGDPATTGATSPTGSVTFASPHGLFLFGRSCTLRAGSGATSFCSVGYLPPDMYLPTLSAAYGGDSTHGPSSGRTQYLGAATDATTTETPRRAAPGSLPSEVDVRFEVPAGSSLVTACALPGGGASARAAGLLGGVVGGVGVGQILRNLGIETNQITQALGGALGGIGDVLQHTNVDVGELLSTFSTDPAQRAQQVQSTDGKAIIDGVLKALKAEGAQCGGPSASGSSVAASTARTRRHIQRLVPLAVVKRRPARAGKLTLRLKLDRRRLARLGAHRRTVRILVRVNLVLPSKVARRGNPRAIGEWVTLRRAKPRHRPKTHSRHQPKKH